MISFWIESPNGHDEKLVPEEKAIEEINSQVADGKWVSVEKTDGTTEMVTKPLTVNEDALDEPIEDSETNGTSEKEDWKGTFGKPTITSGNIKSAQVTNKSKGG